IIEKNKLDEQLEKVNARLKEIQRDSSALISIDDDELMQRASRFVLSQKLQDKRYVDYEKLIGQIDPRVLKDFINSVSTNFCIKNGRVTSITFKNGITHEFIYKDE
ncbi:MAG: hypothetical protein LIO52_00460, partial [Oscillospiraceae bacterium]|nr:hypothetical protein [Oscillospiraceae bacterium]